MTTSVTNPVKTYVLLVLALAMAAMGIYGASDDPPGAPIVGTLLMFVATLLTVRTLGSGLPTWARRGVVAVGALIGAGTAFSIHAASVAAPLFAQPSAVPSVSDPAPPAQWAAAVDRARPMVRAAVMEQNLPGVSISVGAGGAIVWAEGFGWRDIVTETPVTPKTRFNMGTATPFVSAAPVASLDMTDTGTDSAADWSPSHNGEPEDDFPPFTFIHDRIFRPVGLADPARPLPGDRATFYVPRSDDNDPRGGRRPIYMRDLVCCPGGKAFYSTPSDLVRFGLATKAGRVNGELAGGSVMSLITRPDNGLVVVVASNITHANTAALALKVADAFNK